MSGIRAAGAGALLLLLLAVLATPCVHALSASPASMTVRSADGDTSYRLVVTDDEAQPLHVTLTPSGPLAAYITVPASVDIAPGASASLPVRVRIPPVVQPGTVESGILIEGSAQGAGTVAAASAVLHVIKLETPRDGTYLNAALATSSAAVGETTRLTLSLENTGTETLTADPKLYLDGGVYDLGTITIAPGETRALTHDWTPHAIGEYQTSAQVAYGDKQLVVSATITVGTLAVDITGVSFGSFSLGAPVRVSVDALNTWGAELPVETTVSLVQDNRTVTTAVPSSQVLAPLQEGRFTLFLETGAVHAGPAEIRVDARYADRNASESVPVVLGIDSIVPLAARTGGGWSATWPWLVGLAFLIVASIFIYRLRFARGRGNR